MSEFLRAEGLAYQTACDSKLKMLRYYPAIEQPPIQNGITYRNAVGNNSQRASASVVDLELQAGLLNGDARSASLPHRGLRCKV